MVCITTDNAALTGEIPAMKQALMDAWNVEFNRQCRDVMMYLAFEMERNLENVRQAVKW